MQHKAFKDSSSVQVEHVYDILQDKKQSSTYLPVAADFLPPVNEVWGKVIFSQASVIPSVQGEAGRLASQHDHGSHSQGGSASSRGGVCLQGEGVCIQGRWADPLALRDTVNKREVRILTGIHSYFYISTYNIPLAFNGDLPSYLLN